MDDAMFIFAVIPITLGFVGFVFSLVYCSDIMRKYADLKAAYDAHAPQPKPVGVGAEELHLKYEYSEPAPRTSDREMVEI